MQKLSEEADAKPDPVLRMLRDQREREKKLQQHSEEQKERERKLKEPKIQGKGTVKPSKQEKELPVKEKKIRDEHCTKIVTQYIESIINLRSDANIAMFGPKGSGKTTFINTLVVAFRAYWLKHGYTLEEMVNIVTMNTSDQSGHVTKTCQYIDLSPANCPLKIKIIDIWGDEVSENIDTFAVFQALLMGNMKNIEYKTCEAKGKAGIVKDYCRTIHEADRVHFAIFMDSFPNQVASERIAKYFEKTNELGIQSCLVRSKIDQRHSEYLDHPENLQDQDELVDGKPYMGENILLKQLEEQSKITGFSQKDIYPVINPCKENGKVGDPYLTMKIVEIFHHAMICGELFIQKLKMDKQHEFQQKHLNLLNHCPELINVSSIGTKMEWK